MKFATVPELKKSPTFVRGHRTFGTFRSKVEPFIEDLTRRPSAGLSLRMRRWLHGEAGSILHL